MQKWKQFVLQQVVYELYITKKVQKAIEAPRYRFQIELKKVINELY